MKTITLSLTIVALLSMIEVNAQYEPVKYMSDTWAMEDMSNPYGAPSFGDKKKGVYFWRPNNEWYFTTTMKRVADDSVSSGIGYVSFVSTHTSGSYHPVGVGFGSDASGKEYSIDMSAPNGDTVYFEVENVSNQNLNIRIGLKDANKLLIDTKSGTPLTNIPSGIIDLVVPAKSVRSKKFVYQGGFYAEWGDKNKCTDWANPNNKSTPCAIKGFDFKHVTGANITINSTDPQNVGVTDAEIRIRKMSFGLKPVVLEIADQAKQNQHLIISNPVKAGWVEFGELINSCTVFASDGKIVLNSNNSTGIDLSQCKAGLYLLKTEKTVQRLVVE